VDTGRGLSGSGELAPDHTAKEPQIGKRDLHQGGCGGAERFKKRQDGFYAIREGIRLQAVDGAGKDADGGFSSGGGGMSAAGFSSQFEGKVALLSDRDGSSIAFKPGQHAIQDWCAFIDDSLQAYAPLLQVGHDVPRAHSQHFFIMTEGKEDCAAGLEILREQVFNSFHNADHLALDVHAAAPPDGALFNGAGERRVGPFAEGVFIRRNHVLVGHEEDGFQLRSAARPGVKQAAARQHFKREAGVQTGITIAQQLVQLVEQLRPVFSRI